MQPGDILEYRCPNFGIVWQWRVLSICHGVDRQEGLIEVKPVMAGDGFAHGKRMETLWVPEPMTRHLTVVTRAALAPAAPTTPTGEAS